MNSRRELFAGVAVAALLAAAGRRMIWTAKAGTAEAAPASFPVAHSEAEWRGKLTPAAFDVLRRQGTEYPGSSPLDHATGAGRYACAGCDLPLFDAATKFDSHTGWPSFFQPLPAAVATRVDGGFLMQRTEVHCARCGGHLGHVFADGPPPTGMRYCMNGVALQFQPA